MNQQNTQSRRIAISLAAALASVSVLIGTSSFKPAYGQEGMAPSQQTEAVATLAGGCFWCTEAVFERMKGVSDVVSGYIGGTVPNPTYEQVTGKRTGHAEAVEVYYDPSVVTYEEILEVFFKTHDPTTLNRQGNDFGPQYRSAVFYHSPEQKLATEQYIQKLEAAREFRGKIVTEVAEASRFWEAEAYHQDYYRKNPTAGYCRAVVSKKVKKFNNLFQDKKK
ncbi:Peptide methionine sulfoxide reductase MsrA [Rubripirellula obstinata]|uniref:Peptide methionine sulfoxide reductase MsrA n=1 Tax=Rubripirellula obstinata TaxID=406547 RepID=A0A5B1C9G6_9BACT|nr:peptide-methionine (S)-S-oxide reductase MsrA [Rubripirellula obstinata]KAA1257798.1 Peptide methionine sulfoxide reductase MsrA [Rubripirellula obstinata]